MAKVITYKGKRAKSNQVIKWLKGVYFVTPDDPKITDPDTPFRVRVGKAEGKEGIFGRIASHQGSNFNTLYYTILEQGTCWNAFSTHKTAVKLENYIHKILRNEYKVLHRDSWYEFKNLYHFLSFMQTEFDVAPIILEKEDEGLGNYSELLSEYKYTETQISFNQFYDGIDRRTPSCFQWFCTSPVKKDESRGIVFKNGLVYEEYFSNSIGFKQYQSILGGYFYCKPTQLYLTNNKWEDIVIIGKEQNEITERTPFMKLPPGRYYIDQSTPPGDTLIVLGDNLQGDECSLKDSLSYYNYFLDFPCYHMNMNFMQADDTSIEVDFQYRPYDENPTEEQKARSARIINYLKEVKAVPYE